MIENPNPLLDILFWSFAIVMAVIMLACIGYELKKRRGQ